jgi:ESS family glutamate:Na+ symporter
MTIAILWTAGLLLVGMALSLTVPLFRALHVPACVVAGFCGLAVVQLTRLWSPIESPFSQSIVVTVDHWQSWPGVLIAVVFAGMLLERRPSSLGNSLRRAGREGLMVWIIVCGQTMLGLIATWWWIGPRYGLPDAFAMLIETGFAGGHGTAAAMGQVFAHPAVGLEAGLDLGVMMATVGLVYGIVSGVVWINVGIRRGWTRRDLVVNSRPVEHPTGLGTAVVRADVIDPLLLQAVWLLLAFGVGLFLQWTVNSIAQWAAPPPPPPPLPETAAADDPLSARIGVVSIIGTFPLFIYTLFGGLAVRRALKYLGQVRLIDSVTINRLTAAAMDVLVVAAISSLSVNAVVRNAVPISILIVLAAFWTAICLVYLSYWILPRDHWFELGMINYGMSTGTTATGFVLLRMIDPEVDSGAAEDYALAAPLSSPFVGGGMLTIGLPFFVLGRYPIGIVALAMLVLVTLLILLGVWISRRTQG